MRIKSVRSNDNAYVLLLILIFMAISCLMLSGIMLWTSNNSVLTTRNAQLQNSFYAADSAIEKAIASMENDFYQQVDISGNSSQYATNLPSSSDNPFFKGYVFSDGSSSGKIWVTNVINNQTQTNTSGAYAGLIQSVSKFQVIANARYTNSTYVITGAVGQELSMNITPLFQFAIFYQGEMEIEPGKNMVVNGPVHGNGDIYLLPNNVSLTFSNPVTASGGIVRGQDPNDPTSRSFGTLNTVSNGLYSGVPPLTLPVGLDPSMAATNSSANINSNIIGILDIPPAGESPNSTAGTNRYYNKADLIILISNNVVQVTSGVSNNMATVLSTNIWTNFLRTNISLLNTNNNYTNFWNGRENSNVQMVDLDVGKLSQMISNNTLGITGVRTVYIADERTTGKTVLTSNLVSATSTTFPTAHVGTVTTNMTSSSSYPSTFIPGTLTTNTSSQTSGSFPAAGTYVGTPVKNKSGKWVYEKITGYTYGVSYSYQYWDVVSNLITVEPGIRLTNGAALPPNGLTIATPDPVYVQGNYNVSKNGTTVLNSNDTTYTQPAAIIADAITLLSTAWNDSKSAQSVGNRTAANTTVNAAFLTGNVATTANSYSGGVENFPRYLEDWGSATSTYNGSMVCMFNSRFATGAWSQTTSYYNPPTRAWAFDKNFLNPSKLPPSTPKTWSVTRSRWATLPANTKSF